MSFIENAKLNPQQKKAAITTEGPLLILAGAGSGKTRVLTHRIAHLIMDKNVSPWSIMAITFTNKAAKEMKERVEQICGNAGRDVWVSTFHSACVRILHREIENLGYSKDFSIYDSDDQAKVINELVAQRNLSSKEFPAKEIIWVISDAKNKMQSPQKLSELARSSREEIFADIYADYEKKLRASSALDFDDLILKTIILFEKFPEILEKYSRRFRYIHVDEYQDTNMAQYMLVRQLSSAWGNLCVVGDDDQSIYGWRGADIRNILEFEKDFKNTTVIKLEQNYRSTNCILKSANAVIANNDNRKKKTLWSDMGNGEKIHVEELADGRAEAAFVTTEIISHYRDGVSYNDFAVLYRTNDQSRLIEEMLLGSGIPYTVYGGQPFYGRREVKDAIAYLRIITNPDDELALRRIINVPKRGIGDSAVAELATIAANTEDSMLGVILDCASHPVSGRNRAKIEKFSVLVDKLMTDSMLLPPVEFIDSMLEKTGLKAMYSGNTDDDKDRLANLEELSNAAHSYFDDNPDATLTDYLVNVSLVSEPDEQDDVFGAEHGHVTLMTLHSAKGLEFNTVFMVGMEEGIFPLSRAMNEQSELEEERRLCYVGITRAMRRLYMTRADMRIRYGEVKANPPSRFLDEIPSEFCESLLPAPVRAQYSAGRSFMRDSFDDFEPFDMPVRRETKQMQSTLNMGTVNYTKPKVHGGADASWHAGMKVKHRRFGIGTVITVKGSGDETLLSVAFENNGVKNLVAVQANLEIIGE